MYEDELFSTVFVESKPQVNEVEEDELEFPFLGQTQWDEILLVVGWTIQVDLNGLLQPILWKLDIRATLNLNGFQLFRRNRVAWEYVGACISLIKHWHIGIINKMLINSQFYPSVRVP